MLFDDSLVSVTGAGAWKRIRMVRRLIEGVLHVFTTSCPIKLEVSGEWRVGPLFVHE